MNHEKQHDKRRSRIPNPYPIVPYLFFVSSPTSDLRKYLNLTSTILPNSKNSHEEILRTVKDRLPAAGQNTIIAHGRIDPRKNHEGSETGVLRFSCRAMVVCRRFDEVEAMLRTARLELDAARALSKSQAEALVDMAESEKAASRTAQVSRGVGGGGRVHVSHALGVRTIGLAMRPSSGGRTRNHCSQGIDTSLTANGLFLPTLPKMCLKNICPVLSTVYQYKYFTSRLF